MLLYLVISSLRSSPDSLYETASTAKRRRLNETLFVEFFIACHVKDFVFILESDFRRCSTAHEAVRLSSRHAGHLVDR